MKTTIIFGMVLILSFTALADINHYYKIDLLYNQGNLSYNHLAVQPSPQPLQNPEGRYIAEVVSYDNKILNLTFFAIPLTIFYDVADPETGELVDGGVVTLTQSQTNLYIPYYSDAKEINIYDQELIQKLHLDVSSYSKSPEPVPSNFEERVQKELQQQQEVQKIPPKKLIVIGTLLGVLLIAISVILHLFKRRRT